MVDSEHTKFDYSGKVDIRFINFLYYRRIQFRNVIRNFVPHGVPISNVIDIGCGTGVYLDAFDGGIGIDINFNDVQKKERRFVEIDITKKLPFDDGEFDIALLIDVLEHVEIPSELLKEANRITRHGCLIDVPTKDVIPWYYDWVNWWRLKKNKPLKPGVGIKKFGHIHVITKGEWEEMFRQCGFEVSKHQLLRKLSFLECINWFLISHFAKDSAYENIVFRVISGKFVRLLHFFYSVLSRFDPELPSTPFSTFFVIRK